MLRPDTVPIRNGKSVAAIVHEYFPSATDDEIDFLVWNETGWPAFWTGEPEDCFRLQLARAACRENFAMFEYFDGNRLMDEEWEKIKEREDLNAIA